MRANQGAISALSCPATAYCSAQCCRVAAGVRKLEVQLISVVPPTARPCMMVMAPSLLSRPMPSWYSSAVGLGLLHLEVAAGFQRAFLDQQHLEPGLAEDFRGGAATGAAADDGHVGFQGQVLFQA